MLISDSLNNKIFKKRIFSKNLHVMIVFFRANKKRI